MSAFSSSFTRSASSLQRWAQPRLLRLVLSVVALAAIAGTGLVVVPTAPKAQAHAQTPTTPQIRKCEKVDLLLLMDQSGSLDTADPNASQRRAALKSIRRELSEEPRIQIAVIGFDSKLNLHAERFEPASSTLPGHPSDAELEASLTIPSSDAFTDYSVALKGAVDVFGGNPDELCRELVWFTDGIYNTARPSTPEEVEQAEELLDEVCRVIAPSLVYRGVRTQVVLLGDSFAEKARSAVGEEDRQLTELSAQIMRAVTGDETIAGIPVDDGCGSESQSLGNVAGEVLEGEQIDLPNRFLEPLAVIRNLRRWRDCDAFSGDTFVSDELPAGVYIGELEVFSYNGTIERYRLGTDQERVNTRDDSRRRVALGHEDLRSLPSGWVLEFEVAPDPGRSINDVTLSCYSKPVDKPLRMEGQIIDADTAVDTGEPQTFLEAGETYDLKVDTSIYNCGEGELEDLRIDALDASVLTNPQCSDDGTGFSGSFEAVPARERVAEATGQIRPDHVDTLWPEEPDFDVNVEVRPSATVLSDEPLQCTPDDDLPRVEINPSSGAQSPRASILAARCLVVPQPGGVVSVSAESPPGGPKYRLETPDGEPVQQLFRPEDGPQEFRVVSEEMASEDLPQTPGNVTLKAEFQQDDGRSSSLELVELPVKPALGSAIECVTDGSDVAGSGTVGTLPRIEVDGSGSAGSANRLILDECVVPADVEVQGALGGSEAKIGTEAKIEWLETDDGEDRRFLVVVEGPIESDAEMPPVTVDAEMPRVTVIVKPTPRDQYLEVHKQLELPQALSKQLLTCGRNRELPEIRPGLPLHVVVQECRVDPPVSGMVAVTASAQGASFGYFVEAPEGRGEQPWTLISGSEPLILRVVSQELGTNGWNYHGLVTMDITANPTDGLPQSLRHTVDVRSGLLDDLLNCEPMQIVNADQDEVPSDPLQVTVDCEFALRGSEGDLRFTVDAAAPGAGSGSGSSDTPEALGDWRFLPASELLDDGRGLRFGEGETLKQLNLETAVPLPNDRIQQDGTVMVTAEWMMPGWQSPLIASTTTQYTVDLWSRSILWLALIITLIVALVTWFALYSVVVATNRLPKSNNFFARRLEFSTYRDAKGELRSNEIDSFKPDDVPAGFVAGDGKRQKWLRTEDLRVEARHPKWWQIPAMFRGGWGEAKVSGFGGDAGANPKSAKPKPAVPASGTTTTSEQFSELFVVALENSTAGEEPRGVAYVLEPKKPSKRSQDASRSLGDILKDFDPGRHSNQPRPASQRGTSETSPRSVSESELKDASGPPPRSDSRPPPRRERPS